MHIVPVTLSDMLDAREARQRRQQELTARFSLPLVCFTMNIAGERKDTPAIRFAFSRGLDSLLSRLGDPVFSQVSYETTGCTAYLVYDHPAAVIKQAAMETEDTAVGRLYDIDVLDKDGVKQSRRIERRCIVCGAPVFQCARSRAHGLSEVVAHTNGILLAFCAETVSDDAVSALLEEVHLTPKPGLVDENNTGAHTDMDVPLFERSAYALRPFFTRAFLLGADERNGFAHLLACGMDAETAMFTATDGVNTHKGVIYSFLLLLFAFGRIAVRGGDVFDEVKLLCRQDGRARDCGSHGTVGFSRYGALGARGEAEAGFPHARAASEILRTSDAIDALLYLIESVDDTNVLYRGGEDALRFLQRSAHDIRLLHGKERTDALLALDAACIGKHISPGGCADMLAMAILLDKTRALWDDLQ